MIDYLASPAFVGLIDCQIDCRVCEDSGACGGLKKFGEKIFGRIMRIRYPPSARRPSSGLRPSPAAPPVRSAWSILSYQIHADGQRRTPSTVNRLPCLQLIVLFNENLFEILSTWPTLPPARTGCLLGLGCTQSIVFLKVRAQRSLQSCQIGCNGL